MTNHSKEVENKVDKIKDRLAETLVEAGIAVADAETEKDIWHYFDQLEKMYSEATHNAVEEERERIMELVAHHSYEIDPGGHVSKRSKEVEDVCHEIIQALKDKTN